MTDTPLDKLDWIDGLIQLMESQDAIVRALDAIAPEQASCIAAGQVDTLLVVLARRQELVESLLSTQASLTTMTRNLEERLAGVPAGKRDRVHELMDSVDRTMQSVLARDEEDRARLQEQRDAVRGGLSELDAGRRARHGYQSTPQTGETHRFADARG